MRWKADGFFIFRICPSPRCWRERPSDRGIVNGRAKNISRDPDGRIQGDGFIGRGSETVGPDGRFAQNARDLYSALSGFAAGIGKAHLIPSGESPGAPIRRAT
jgi:hypothetical protein